MAANDHLAAIQAWRWSRSQSAAAADLQRLAFDLVVDHYDDFGFDPGFYELAEDERVAYLEHAARSLAEALTSALEVWVVTDLPLVEEWQRGQR